MIYDIANTVGQFVWAGLAIVVLVLIPALIVFGIASDDGDRPVMGVIAALVATATIFCMGVALSDDAYCTAKPVDYHGPCVAEL